MPFTTLQNRDAFSICVLSVSLTQRASLLQGTPVAESYAETSPGSNVFRREWTKADVRFDCNTGKATIAMKAGGGQRG